MVKALRILMPMNPLPSTSQPAQLAPIYPVRDSGPCGGGCFEREPTCASLLFASRCEILFNKYASNVFVGNAETIQQDIPPKHIDPTNN